MFIQGHIISGEFDQSINEFSLQKVKNLFIESTISENQMTSIYNYLKKHEHINDGQVITLYDQLPILLSQEEIKLLLSDLEQVQSMYH
ncbi:hypothetical protein ACE1TI_21060 [Alteribacillus sp. JSM 102045]|uniref:hypothetical protein n=1 Tax=Alteribacillus sp. JSM 102045 TaxID=1562101 RepID=UPI0035C11FEE